MSEFVAGAFVDVRPEAKGFRAELKRDLDAAVKNQSIKLPVTIDQKSLKAAIATAQKSAKIRVPIEIGGSIADLRKQIKSKVDAAAKGIKVVVPVEVKATAARGQKVTTPPAATPAKVPLVVSTTVADLKKQIKDKIDAAQKGQKIIIPIEVKGIEKLPKNKPVPVPVQPTPAKTTAAAAKAPPVKVPIQISTTIAELKTALKTKVDAAAKGVKAVISAEVKGVAKVTTPKAALTPSATKVATDAKTSAAKPAPVKVPIEISTTVADLKKAIKSKLDSAATGLKIKVPIEVVSTGKAVKAPAVKQAAAPAAASTKAATQAATQTQTAQAKTTTTTKKLTAAEERAKIVKDTLAKSDKDLAIAERLLAQAQEKSISAEESSTRLRESKAAATRAAKSVNDTLATSEQKLNKTQVAALNTQLKTAQGLRIETQEKQKALTLNTKLADSDSKSAKARSQGVDVMKVEIKSIKDLNQLHLVENDLLAAEARLKRETNKARELGATATVQTNEALQQQISAQRQAVILQRAELKGEGQRVKTQKTAARGAASTALSLLGVRGATLAANSAFLSGAAALGLFAKAISSFADFETELNVFQAAASATDEQMKEVAHTAHQLGADITLPAVTSADAAQAMSELSRAGLNVHDSIEGARGVLELASAAFISNADAASLTASALNAFSLEGEDATHVADLLANAANASQGSISEMGAAMQQASAIAHQVGLSLDDTVATLTLFARHGLRGSDAGTSLRTALSRLIAPTKQASDLIAQLGLNTRDAAGNIRADVFAQFGEATKDLSPALRDMIAETLAGQDAIRAFAIGADEGRAGLKRAQLQMATTGSAAALAAARSKGLGGTFRAIGSNAETLGVQLGKLASGPIKEAGRQLNEFLVTLNALASGDLATVFDQFEKDGERFFRNMQRHFGGAQKILGSFGTANPRDSLGQLGAGLNELFTPAPENNRLVALQEALADLQNIRLLTFNVSGESAIGDVTKEIKRIKALLKAEKIDSGLIIPVTPLEKALEPLETARKAVEDFKKDALETGAAPSRIAFLDTLLTNFNARIKLVKKQFKDNAKVLKKGFEEGLKGIDIADSFKQQIDLIAANVDLATPDVLEGLNNLARRIGNTAPVTGAAGKKVGEALMGSITAAMQAAAEEDNPDLVASLKALATKIAALFGGELGAAFKNLKVPLTDQQLEDALLPARIKTARAEAFGSISAQISAKQDELDALTKQLDTVIKGSSQEEKVLSDISAKKGEIRSLREQQATDQKEKDKASDDKVLATLSGEERRLVNDLTNAQTTETLKDDIRRQLALKAFYQRQIQTIKATVRDAEERREQIAEAEDNLADTERALAEDRRGRRDQLREIATTKIDEAAERAAETETLADDLRQAQRKVRFWKRQVEVIKQLVKDRKATADELKAARDELDAAEDEARVARRARRDQQREEARTGFELDISFAETTENAGAETAARRRFIKFLEDQKKFYKGNKNKLKEIRNEIAEQKKAIEEINDEAKKNGTTAFELLTEAANTFRATGGNLIGGDQPFAGPAGFTADMAQFLRRQEKSATTATPLPGKAPVSDSLSRNDQAHFGRLSSALEKLTETIERQPGTGKVPARGKTATGPAEGRNHYVIATQARQVVERRSGI